MLELAVKLAASVLLWLSTRVGLFTLATTLAIVNVLPDPVTPEQRLGGLARQHAVRELADGLGLIARRGVFGSQLERIHGSKITHLRPYATPGRPANCRFRPDMR